MTPEQRLDAVERLQQMRDSGALNEAEFEAEKQRLLRDRPVRRGRMVAIFVAAVVLIGAGVALWVVSYRTPAPVRPVATLDSRPKVAPLPGLGTPQALSAAFETATGHAEVYASEVDGQPATTSPLRLLDMPFGPVLLTSTEIAEGCHACTGAIGVYYLERRGEGFAVKGKWPQAISGWGWGAAPADWSVTDKFTSYPAIYAEGGFTAQGYTCGSATITELRPDGPVTSDLITLSYSNGGAVMDNGMTMGGEAERELNGRITHIVRDQGFDVVVPGEPIREHYVRKGNRFVRATVDTQLSC
ncbi:SHOCT domain-containing protein [Sphingobium sp.]|uniref:SHOCT domain-containing protein n=1 Tax=Sphingobium sp. TaxID=1912891 RepID=UPI0035C6C38C